MPGMPGFLSAVARSWATTGVDTPHGLQPQQILGSASGRTSVPHRTLPVVPLSPSVLLVQDQPVAVCPTVQQGACCRKSDHPLGRQCFGLRLFSPDFVLGIAQHQHEINPWLKPTQALASARPQGTAALRAICKTANVHIHNRISANRYRRRAAPTLVRRLVPAPEHRALPAPDSKRRSSRYGPRRPRSRARYTLDRQVYARIHTCSCSTALHLPNEVRPHVATFLDR